MTREVSFQGVTVRLDPDETTTVSGFECAARLHSHSLKPGWPNVWHQRRAKRVRCMPGLGPAYLCRYFEETRVRGPFGGGGSRVAF